MEEEDEARVSSSFHIKLSGLPQGTTVKDIREYLSNECDCGVKEVTFLSKNDAVTKVFVTDIDEFLKKGHCIKETFVKVTLEDEAERTETQTDIIEVTGDDDIETLKFYFEGRRSGGNRSKAIEYVTKVDANVVHVRFKSTDDAAAVIAQERHLIAGTALNVYYAPVPASRRYKGDKLIIQNIPKGTEQKKLIVFIEAKLDLEFEEEFKLEMHNQVAIMSLQSSYNDEELQEMAETLASQQIAGQHLTVNLCEINHSIIVSGISNKNFIGNDDALQSYFESGRSGGGENTVKMLTPTKSKIMFQDPSVIPEVLKKKHEKLGSNIVTEACSVFDALNESSEYKEEKESDDEGEDSFVLLKKSPNRKFSETDGASAHQSSIILDSPVQEPSPILDLPVYHPLKLDPLLLKYVRLKCAHLLKSVAQEFNVSFAFNDDNTLAISPTMSSPPEWQTNSIEMINDIISNSLTKHTMSVPSQAAAAVYPVVMKCCSEEGLEYDFGQKGSDELSIAGNTVSVSKVKGDVEEIVNRIVKQEEELRVDTRQNYVYLKEYMLPIMQAKHPSLVLQCNDSYCTVSVAGSVNDVEGFKASFNHYLAHEQLSVDLRSEAVTFLQGESGKQVLQSFTKDAAVVPYFTCRDNDPRLLLLCQREHVLQMKKVAITIAQNIVVSLVDIPWEYQTQVTSTEISKFDAIIKGLAEKYAFNASVDDNIIILVSTAQDRAAVHQELMNLISKNFVPVPHNTLSQPLDPLIASYIRLNESHSLETIEKEFQVSIIFSNDKTIAITPTVSSPPDWQTRAVAMMEDIIFSLVKKDSVSIPNEAAGAVYPMVMKFCSEKNLQYEFGEGGSDLSIAGRAQFVKKLKDDIREMSNRIIRELDELEVESPEDYTYLKEYMLPIMQERHPSLTLECNDNRLTVSVSGSVKDVKEFKDIYTQYLSHQKIAVNLSSEAVKYLRDSGQRVLNTLMTDAKVVLYFSTDGANHYLHLLHQCELASQAEALAVNIEQAVATESHEIPWSFHDQVDAEKYLQFKFRLVEKYAAFTSVINGNELTVVCTSNDMKNVIRELTSFITEACTCFETINFKSGEWRLFQTALKVEWNEATKEIEKKGIDIVTLSKSDAAEPYIHIKGEAEAVQSAKEKIISLQKSVKSKKIKFPHVGICPYFLSDPNGKYILKGVENTAGVCIEVEVEGMSSNVFKEVFTGVTNEMMTVCVVVGDITEFDKAEVIVNAANEELKHRGGVAAAIARKGGPIIQQKSDEYIRRNKKVMPGEAVCFDTTGNLPSTYKAIVHAVGPRYRAEEKQNATALLKEAVYQSLESAKDHESIAFPAIGGGHFGFPITVCASVHFKAVVEFSKKLVYPSKLKKVYFVIIKDNADFFVQAAGNYITENVPVEAPPIESLKLSSSTQSFTPSAITSSMPPTLTPVSAHPKGKIRSKCRTKSESAAATGLEFIKITNGSITVFAEEALVNTTDENLKLEGYVSKVLLKEAGPGLKKECEGVSKPLRVGSLVTTGAHNLKKSKYILHVVLPSYDGKSEGVLREIVTKCLEECTHLRVKTLSIPSIGAGNLKYPHSVVANALIEETASFFQKNQRRTTLTLVHFVIYEQNIYEEFRKVLRVKKDLPHLPSTLSSMPILITKGSVIDHQEEAIVHTNDCKLELKAAVGQVLAKKAGPELKKECDAMKTPINYGSVIATKGYNLKAKYILHVILHSCNSSDDESEKVLRRIVVKCLDECTRLKVRRLSMTSIGAGNLKYPSRIVARALIEETAAYLETNQGMTTLELVRFVIYDQSVYDEFSKVYEQFASSATAIKQKIFSLSQGVQLKLVEGEIGNDSSGVIVTYDEAASQVEKKPVMNVIQSVGGLGRKMTLPVTFHHSSSEQKKFSFACLDMAEKQKFDSIAFPAGFRGNTLQIAPKAIVDASVKFVATNPTYVKVICVLYTSLSPEIIQQYEEALRSQMNGQEIGLKSMAKAIGSAVASAVGYSHESRPYFEETPTFESEVVLHIFGKSDKAISTAEKTIKDTVNENFVNRKIEDENIVALSDEKETELLSYARGCNVKIDINRDQKRITLLGFQDVHRVESFIQNVLRTITEEESKKALAGVLYQNVRWVRLSSQEGEEEYNELVSYEIEQAYQRKDDVYDSKEYHFFINFKKMIERDKLSDKTAKVRRIEDFVPLPEEWSLMPMNEGKENVFYLEQLSPVDSEYITVENAFNVTMTAGQNYTEIVTIKRIQNPTIYKQYTVRKKEMDRQNPTGHVNERWLWHGTNLETTEKINAQGFNRSYAGKHATAFGRGVYFATDSSYSHRYADPDANGHRYMYYVQVLTGEYVRGDKNMIVPPLKVTGQQVLYDSTVNDESNPTIFVVYQDSQNYPAYLVHYR